MMKKLLLFTAFVIGVTCVRAQDYPGNFALRTNLLYDALLTPTLGAEWRISDAWGVKLDGSYGYFTGSAGKIHNAWLVSPEVRRYLGKSKRFYLGLGANAGGYDIYRLGPVAALFRKGTGYAGELYNGGLVGGYQLKLSNAFSLDFNIGLGYTHLKYDAFTMERCESCTYRKSKKTNANKNFFGPTQAGISLVWHFGKSKEKPAGASDNLLPVVPVQETERAVSYANAANAVDTANVAHAATNPANAANIANTTDTAAANVANKVKRAMIQASPVLFMFNSSTLTGEAKTELGRIARWLKENQPVYTVIEGYTDNTGTATYNQRLSEKRARAVYDYLVSEGIVEERLSCKGYGLSHPKEPNSTTEGRHHNRRVELRMME